jgi:amidase
VAALLRHAAGLSLMLLLVLLLLPATGAVAPPTRLSSSIFHPFYPSRVVPGAVGGPLTAMAFVASCNIDAAGLRTCNGSPAWALSHQPSRMSAPCLGVLLRAGAALVGMSHMDELGLPLSENAHFGVLDNPAAPGRSVGGSASGAAFAVAAGEADLAVATDTVGGLRVPASHCGLYALRPTHGTVSLDGVCALAPSLDTLGILAKNSSVMLAAAFALLGGSQAAARPPPRVRVLVADDAFRLFARAEVGGQLFLGLDERSRLGLGCTRRGG